MYPWKWNFKILNWSPRMNLICSYARTWSYLQEDYHPLFRLYTRTAPQVLGAWLQTSCGITIIISSISNHIKVSFLQTLEQRSLWVDFLSRPASLRRRKRKIRGINRKNLPQAYHLCPSSIHKVESSVAFLLFGKFEWKMPLWPEWSKWL